MDHGELSMHSQHYSCILTFFFIFSYKN